MSEPWFRHFIGYLVELKFPLGHRPHEVRRVNVRIVDVKDDHSGYARYGDGTPITEWCWAKYA